MKKLLTALLTLGLFCDEAIACSCPAKSLNEFVKNADEIYVATLEEAKVVKGKPNHKWPFIESKFKIYRTLKGSPRTGGMMLRTGLGGGDCGVPMSVGNTYIIFKSAEIVGINDCDGSRRIENFEELDVAAKVKAAMSRKSPHQ